MEKNVFIALLLLLGGINVVGQNRDLLNIEFGALPTNDETVSLNTVELKLKIPVKLKKGVLINGISYSKVKLNYEDEQLLNTNEIEEFNFISYSLSYIRKMNDKWSYSLYVSPEITSNFESSLTFEDVNINGGIIFNKTTNSGYLSFGVIKNSRFGLSIPIPIVRFSKQVNEKLSYELGIPVTKVQYQFNKRNNASLFVKPKGFTANLSNNIQINNGLASKANYMSVITGLNFQHLIDECWSINLNGGYQIYSKYSLKTNNTKIYEFNTSNGMYGSVGLNFNFKNNKKRKNLL